MSVINKMLRDLDQRQRGAAEPRPLQGLPVAPGTVPLAALPDTAQPALTQRRLAWGGGLLLAVAAAGVWYLQSSQKVSGPTAAVVVATPATVITAPAVAPVPAPAPIPAPAPVSVPVAAAVSPLPPAPQAVPKVQAAIATPPPAPAKAPPPVRAPVTEAAGEAQRTDKALAKSPSPSASIAAPAAGAPSASDALARAQLMWNAGSRLAAMDLLQQTLSQVEAASTSAVTGQSTLARLALELARMNLAEGRVSQALALLTRLEPQLFQIADVWAMRGSAAQRLGQHSEAVRCYRQALLLKPDEPRWMLGQAVSLAAQGQVGAAGEMAEMARVLGGLRPEVANYLRQLGVAVRTD